MSTKTTNVSRFLGLAIAGACTVLVAKVAHAEQRFEVSMGGGAKFVPMDSMDALSADTAYAALTIDGMIALPELAIVPGYAFEAGLRWDAGTLTGTTFNRVQSELGLDTLAATARLHRKLATRLSAFGHGELGVQWASLRLEDVNSASARALQGKAKAAVIGIGGGVEFDMSARELPDFRFGFRLEGNYELASSMSFAGTPMSASSDDLVLTTNSAQLGSVNTSGMHIGMSLVARF